MNIPSLRTERLRLRPFRLDDLDALAAMYADPEVRQHIGTGEPVGRDIVWRNLALFLGHWPLHGHGMWALERRSDGRLIGRAGYFSPEGWPGIELGWLLARDAWGQGYAFEAAKAALAFGRAELGLGTVISLIRAENTRSIALAQRLGAHDTGAIDLLGRAVQRFEHAPP